MRIIYLSILLLLLVSCSDNHKWNFKEIASKKVDAAVFETINSNTKKLTLDTLNMKKDGNKVIGKYINDSNENEKMALIHLLDFNYVKEEIQEMNINYDLLGDSLRYLDSIRYNFGKIQEFDINNKIHKIIKQPEYASFSKSNKPDSYNYFSKEYGLIGLVNNNEKSILKYLNGQELHGNEKILVQQLKNDTTFFQME